MYKEAVREKRIPCNIKEQHDPQQYHNYLDPQFFHTVTQIFRLKEISLSYLIERKKKLYYCQSETNSNRIYATLGWTVKSLDSSETNSSCFLSVQNTYWFFSSACYKLSTGECNYTNEFNSFYECM